MPVFLWRTSLDIECEFETDRNMYIIPNTKCLGNSEMIITENMVTQVAKNSLDLRVLMEILQTT